MSYKNVIRMACASEIQYLLEEETPKMGSEYLTLIKANSSNYLICALGQVFWLPQLWFSLGQRALKSHILLKVSGTEPTHIPQSTLSPWLPSTSVRTPQCNCAELMELYSGQEWFILLGTIQIKETSCNLNFYIK